MLLLPACAAQVKWKDLLTDLNLVPSSLNVERLEEDSGLQRLIKAASPNTEVRSAAGGGALELDVSKLVVAASACLPRMGTCEA